MLMHSPPRVSVVVPAKDEAGNLPALVDEIAAALAGQAFEIVVVNDASRDDTAAVLARLARERSYVRQILHAEPCGQSAAIATGVKAARGELVATLDGDGQNDPRYLPALLALLDDRQVGLAAGQRLKRQASFAKKLASKGANALRSGLLRDETRDTGCGLKAFRRALFLEFPYFDGMHRFLPALALREGFGVRHLDVVDRPRRHGRSKYGVLDRALIGALDLFGVWWLRRRRKRVPVARELECTDV